MKNFVFFVLTLLLLGACNGSTLDLPPASKPEVKMYMSVSKDIVKPGDTITVTWSTENAEQLTSNFGAQIGIQNILTGSYDVVINDKTTLSMTAIGGGKSVTRSESIALLPIILPKIAKDTIISSPWTFIQIYFSLDKIVWAKVNNLDAVKGRIYNFSANNTMTIFNPPFGSSDLWGPYDYKIEGRDLTIRTTKYYFILTDKRLEIYLEGQYVTETGENIPCWYMEVYTR